IIIPAYTPSCARAEICRHTVYHVHARNSSAHRVIGWRTSYAAPPSQRRRDLSHDRAPAVVCTASTARMVVCTPRLTSHTGGIMARTPIVVAHVRYRVRPGAHLEEREHRRMPRVKSGPSTPWPSLEQCTPLGTLLVEWMWRQRPPTPVAVLAARIGV